MKNKSQLDVEYWQFGRIYAFISFVFASLLFSILKLRIIPLSS